MTQLKFAMAFLVCGLAFVDGCNRSVWTICDLIGTMGLLWLVVYTASRMADSVDKEGA